MIVPLRDLTDLSASAETKAIFKLAEVKSAPAIFDGNPGPISPVKSQPCIWAFTKLDPYKSHPSNRVNCRLAPDRLALDRLAQNNSSPDRSTPVKSAPLKLTTVFSRQLISPASFRKSTTIPLRFASNKPLSTESVRVLAKSLTFFSSVVNKMMESGELIREGKTASVKYRLPSK